VFTISMFPILWVSAWIDANPDVYLWEKIRPLEPLPDVYTERFPNVQAAIGLDALKKLDEWTERTRAHAAVMDRALSDLPGIAIPAVPAKRTHVYYQYCVYGPQRDELVVKCVRKGIDIETLHVDVCPEMALFADARVEPAGVPGAVKAAGAMQVPVYSSLTDAQIQRVAKVVRSVLS
jgi:perosamine synthetase